MEHGKRFPPSGNDSQNAKRRLRHSVRTTPGSAAGEIGGLTKANGVKRVAPSTSATAQVALNCYHPTVAILLKLPEEGSTLVLVRRGNALSGAGSFHSDRVPVGNGAVFGYSRSLKMRADQVRREKRRGESKFRHGVDRPPRKKSMGIPGDTR